MRDEHGMMPLEEAQKEAASMQKKIAENPGMSYDKAHKEVSKGENGTETEENPDKLIIEQNFQPHWDLPTDIPDEIIKALKETGSYNENSQRVWNAIRSGVGSVFTANPRGWEESYEMITRVLDEENPQEWSETCRDMRHTFINQAVNVDLIEDIFPNINFYKIQTPEQAQELVEWAKSQVDLLPEINAFSERFEEQVRQFGDKSEQEQGELFAEIERVDQEIIKIVVSKIDHKEKLFQLIPLAKQLEALEHIPWYLIIACNRFRLRDRESRSITFERDLDLTSFERELYNSAVDVASGVSSYYPDHALVTQSLIEMERRIKFLIEREAE